LAVCKRKRNAPEDTAEEGTKGEEAARMEVAAKQ